MQPSDGSEITGAEALLKSLIEEGVDTIFGYPGGAIMPVYDKLLDYLAQCHENKVISLNSMMNSFRASKGL